MIQPSKSLQTSGVILVRQRDCSLCFCVNYLDLNACSNKSRCTLNAKNRRGDFLDDKLGSTKYFSALNFDLAKGYWQIKVQSDNQKKTTFITPQGLYEFRVMPFVVMDALAVFQRLMQKVLSRLMTGPKYFVAVYLDSVLFSQSLHAHLEHLTKSLTA